MTRYPSPSKIFFDGFAAFVAPTANEKQNTQSLMMKYCEFMTNAEGLDYRNVSKSLNSQLNALGLRDDLDGYDSLVSFLCVELQLRYATVQSKRDNARDNRQILAFDPKQAKPLPCLVLQFQRYDWGPFSSNHDIELVIFGTKSYVDTFEASLEQYCRNWFLHHRVGPPTRDDNWTLSQSYH